MPWASRGFTMCSMELIMSYDLGLWELNETLYVKTLGQCLANGKSPSKCELHVIPETPSDMEWCHFCLAGLPHWHPSNNCRGRAWLPGPCLRSASLHISPAGPIPTMATKGSLCTHFWELTDILLPPRPHTVLFSISVWLNHQVAESVSPPLLQGIGPVPA